LTSGINVVPQIKAKPSSIKALNEIGRYAIGVQWSDGHDSGIYYYNFLREVCPCPTCRGGR